MHTNVYCIMKHLYMYVHTYMCVCICIHIRVCIYIYIYIYIHTYNLYVYICFMDATADYWFRTPRNLSVSPLSGWYSSLESNNRFGSTTNTLPELC